jgi:Zn-dependent M16 (insulinase) family peptidase
MCRSHLTRTLSTGDSHQLDPSSALKFKGVVYNEMKGAMVRSSCGLFSWAVLTELCLSRSQSEGDSIFYQALHSNLFSKTTYKNNSGGEPKAIPDLTYDQLIEFHRSHYHPSNAWCAQLLQTFLRS